MAPSILSAVGLFSGGVVLGVTTGAYLASASAAPKPKAEGVIVEQGRAGGPAILDPIGGFRKPSAAAGEVWKLGYPGEYKSPPELGILIVRAPHETFRATFQGRRRNVELTLSLSVPSVCQSRRQTSFSAKRQSASTLSARVQRLVDPPVSMIDPQIHHWL
jgi:hypothetical protein